MIRKLVKQGDNALTITLPAQWTKKFNLKPGDGVEVAEQGAEIIVSTSKDTESQRLTLNVSGSTPMVRRILGSAYKAGFDEFEVIFEKPEELKEIQFGLDSGFVGFEIVEQGKNRILAKKITDIEHGEFDTMLRRIFLFLMQMAEDTLESLRKDEIDELQTIALRDNSINRFTDFCRRALNKKAAVKYKRIPPLYYIIEDIEKVGDCYRDLCRIISNNKIKLSKQALNVMVLVNKFLREFYELFYSFDLKKIGEFGRKREEIKKEFDKLFEGIDKKEMKAVFEIYNAFNVIFDMNGPLMAMNF